MILTPVPSMMLVKEVWMEAKICRSTTPMTRVTWPRSVTAVKFAARPRVSLSSTPGTRTMSGCNLSTSLASTGAYSSSPLLENLCWQECLQDGIGFLTRRRIFQLVLWELRCGMLPSFILEQLLLDHWSLPSSGWSEPSLSTLKRKSRDTTMIWQSKI